MGREKKKKLKHKRRESKKRSISSSSTSSSQEYRKRKKLKKEKREYERKNKSLDAISDTSSDSSDESINFASPEQEYYENIRKELKNRYKQENRELKLKIKEEKAKNKKLKNKLDKEERDVEQSSDVSLDLMDRKSMAPMTKEEWEKKQSIIQKIEDEETGRVRSVRFRTSAEIYQRLRNSLTKLTHSPFFARNSTPKPSILKVPSDHSSLPSTSKDLYLTRMKEAQTSTTKNLNVSNSKRNVLQAKPAILIAEPRKEMSVTTFPSETVSVVSIQPKKTQTDKSQTIQSQPNKSNAPSDKSNAPSNKSNAPSSSRK